MTFSIDYPKCGETVRELFVASGSLGNEPKFKVSHVKGLLRAEPDVFVPHTAVHYDREINECRKRWWLVFSGLDTSKTYTLHVFDQDNNELGSQTDIKVAATPVAPDIFFPLDHSFLGSSFGAYGTTDQGDILPLACREIAGITGNVIMRQNGWWALAFNGVPKGGPYELHVGHAADCTGSDTKTDLHVN